MPWMYLSSCHGLVLKHGQFYVHMDELNYDLKASLHRPCGSCYRN
jgi:hypothetical protein